MCKGQQIFVKSVNLLGKSIALVACSTAATAWLAYLKVHYHLPDQQNLTNDYYWIK